MADFECSEKLIIVLIGASGFVGTGILKHLLENREDVVNKLIQFVEKNTINTTKYDKLIVRCCSRNPEVLNNKIKKNSKLKEIVDTGFSKFGIVLEFVECDVREKDSIRKVIENAQFIINAVGLYKWYHEKEEDYFAINETGAINVFGACYELAEGLEEDIKSGKAFTPILAHISTVLAYGSALAKSGKEFTEQDAEYILHEPNNFCSKYAYSKSLGDQKIRERYKKIIGCGEHNSADEYFGLKTRLLPLACVLGEGDVDNLAQGRPGCVQRDFILGKIPALVEPETEFIYVDIEDVAKSVTRALYWSPKKIQHDNTNINADAFSEFLIGNWKDRMTTRLYFQRMESWNKMCAEEDQNRLKCEDNNINSTQLSNWRKNGNSKMLLPENAAKCPSRTIPISLLSGMSFIGASLGFSYLLPPDIVEQAKRGPVLFSCQKADDELCMRDQYTPIGDSVRKGIISARRLIADEFIISSM